MRECLGSSAWCAVAGAIAVFAILGSAPALGVTGPSAPPTGSTESGQRASLGLPLPFSPELTARIKRVGAVNAPVGLSTTISQSSEESFLKRAQVILPAGLGGNNDVLNNQCSDAAFNAGNCPQASIVGTAEAHSPLAPGGLSGPVVLLQPVAPGLPDLGIDLRGALPQKLKGTLGFTADGRNITVFDNLPNAPISAFTLTFTGGPGGLVAPARDVCAPPPLVFDANFDSHLGASVVTTASATVDCTEASGGGGGGGGGEAPRAKIKLGRLGSDQPTMGVRIEKGSEKLRHAKLVLPRQLGFAAGEDFDHGASIGGNKVKVKHSRRTLKLNTRKPLGSFTARFADGALTPEAGLRPGSKLKFKLKLRDASGATTKLTVRAR